MTPENRPSQKETIVFNHPFSGAFAVSFREGTFLWVHHELSLSSPWGILFYKVSQERKGATKHLQIFSFKTPPGQQLWRFVKSALEGFEIKTKTLWHSMKSWLVNRDPGILIISGQIKIFHKPRSPWNNGISLSYILGAEVVWGRYNLTR